MNREGGGAGLSVSLSCTLIAIPLVGHMKVLHTLIIGMSSAALVAAVALPR